MGYYAMKPDKFLETVFDMVEIYSNELDRVAVYLLDAQPRGIRAYEAEEKKGKSWLLN